MLWVGGGIIIHSLAGYGLGAIEHGIHAFAQGIAGLIKPFSCLVDWLMTAAASGIFGLIVGFCAVKAWASLRHRRKPASA